MDIQKTTHDSISKKYIYIIIGVIVLVIAAWAIYAYNHQYTPATGDSGQSAMLADNSDNAQIPTTAPDSGSPTHTIKQYEAALVTYAKVRIQFLNCVATPNAMTLKNPATIMLDNRSTTTSDIMIDQKTYAVRGLDYEIVTISEPLLPVHSEVECDNSQNVASLLIEK